MTFAIKIDQDAIRDIEEAIIWYESQQKGLSKQFLVLLEEHIDRLRSNPYFQIKYSDVRCLPIKKFPFMIHYTLEENTQSVIIRAVFNTHINPSIWRKRK